MNNDVLELRRTEDPAIFAIHLKRTGEQLGQLLTNGPAPTIIAFEGPHADDLTELADELYDAVQEAVPYAPLLSPFSP